MATTSNRNGGRQENTTLDPNEMPQPGGEEMFEAGEGRREDGSIGVPKITMSTIRAFPERCKRLNNGEGGAMKIATFTGVANGMVEAVKQDTGEVFFGLKGDFGAVRFDDKGEPDAIYKADTIYLPIGHQAALQAFERTGRLNFALEFWAQPAHNPAGYSWTYKNLAKLDRNNLSPIDRLLMLSVSAGRQIAVAGQSAGLLSDMRTDTTAAAAD